MEGTLDGEEEVHYLFVVGLVRLLVGRVEDVVEAKGAVPQVSNAVLDGKGDARPSVNFGGGALNRTVLGHTQSAHSGRVSTPASYILVIREKKKEARRTTGSLDVLGRASSPMDGRAWKYFWCPRYCNVHWKIRKLSATQEAKVKGLQHRWMRKVEKTRS